MLGKMVSRLTVSAFAGSVRALPRSAAFALTGCVLMALSAFVAAFLIAPAPLKAQQGAGEIRSAHMGVASCAGSTCHGRSIGDGTPVRQDELRRWQEESSPSGAHSRAYRVIREPRGVAIIKRMNLDDAGVQRECLGCHSSPKAARINEGVDPSPLLTEVPDSTYIPIDPTTIEGAILPEDVPYFDGSNASDFNGDYYEEPLPEAYTAPILIGPLPPGSIVTEDGRILELIGPVE